MEVALGYSRHGIFVGRAVCLGVAVFLLLDLYFWGEGFVHGGPVERSGC